jgi:hypothetical protein
VSSDRRLWRTHIAMNVYLSYHYDMDTAIVPVTPAPVPLENKAEPLSLRRHMK